MGEGPHKNMSREERLAAKLRENLRRRKAQSRALGEQGEDDSPGDTPTETLAKPGGAG